ncbi:hypothetical protein ACU4GH_28990 [Bradyrhizobium betae]
MINFAISCLAAARLPRLTWTAESFGPVVAIDGSATTSAPRRKDNGARRIERFLEALRSEVAGIIERGRTQLHDVKINGAWPLAFVVLHEFIQRLGGKDCEGGALQALNCQYRAGR